MVLERQGNGTFGVTSWVSNTLVVPGRTRVAYLWFERPEENDGDSRSGKVPFPVLVVRCTILIVDFLSFRGLRCVGGRSSPGLERRFLWKQVLSLLA
jgi:hypothetical protein